MIFPSSFCTKQWCKTAHTPPSAEVCSSLEEVLVDSPCDRTIRNIEAPTVDQVKEFIPEGLLDYVKNPYIVQNIIESYLVLLKEGKL